MKLNSIIAVCFEIRTNGKELESIQCALGLFPNLDKVVLFGTRALGTNRPESDVDLAIYGDLRFNEFLEVK